MNVNVMVDPEIILCQHHVRARCFCQVHIFASTEYLTLISGWRDVASQNHINLLLIVPIGC